LMRVLYLNCFSLFENLYSAPCPFGPNMGRGLNKPHTAVMGSV
jgi:hypothetical protein